MPVDTRPPFWWIGVAAILIAWILMRESRRR